MVKLPQPACQHAHRGGGMHLAARLSHASARGGRMPKAKRTNAKAQHKDSAAKNTMNPPHQSSALRRSLPPGPSGVEQAQPKREVGQFSGPGQAPLMKK